MAAEDPAGDYLTRSFASLRQSSLLLRSYPFRRANSLAAAALADEHVFETYLVRDVEPHERALFQPTPSTSAPVPPPLPPHDPALPESDKWTATQRAAPRRAVGARDKASPLKERRTATGNDPARALKAALKLLDVYPLPRAREHVDALLAQYEGRLETNAELEETLKRPLSRAAAAPQPGASSTADAAREEAYKREEMEIFALQQLNLEKQAERDALIAKATKPPPKPKSVPAPIDTTPTTPPTATSKSNRLDRQGARPSASPRASPKTPPSTKTTPKGIVPPSPLSPVASPSTPKATAVASHALTPPTVKKKPKSLGIPPADLEVVAEKVWNGVGDALRPWARKMLVREGVEVPTPLTRLPFDETIRSLATVLSHVPGPAEPTSPASSFATLTSELEDADPLPPTPPQLVEFELLNLFLSTLAGRPPLPSTVPLKEPPIPLGITYRDAVLASSLVPLGTGGTSPTVHKREKEPMVSMNGIKAALGAFAAARGWKEDLGTSAVYSLVSKTVLRIDRRGKEGPMIGLRA